MHVCVLSCIISCCFHIVISIYWKNGVTFCFYFILSVGCSSTNQTQHRNTEHLHQLTQYFDSYKLHVYSINRQGSNTPPTIGDALKGGTRRPMLPCSILSLLKCLLNYISSRPRLESPLSTRAIDTPALSRLTRGFVCCG